MGNHFSGNGRSLLRCLPIHILPIWPEIKFRVIEQLDVPCPSCLKDIQSILMLEKSVLTSFPARYRIYPNCSTASPLALSSPSSKITISSSGSSSRADCWSDCWRSVEEFDRRRGPGWLQPLLRHEARCHLENQDANRYRIDGREVPTLDSDQRDSRSH